VPQRAEYPSKKPAENCTQRMTDAEAAATWVRLVQRQYLLLGKTGKPQAGEWTVLAGFVLTRPGADPEVVALGTGTKCLSAAAICEDKVGGCLHDSHAEVCARRSLLLYLMDEVSRCAQDNSSSIMQPSPDGSGVELCPDVQLHLYTSAPPCGDAAVFGVKFTASQEKKRSLAETIAACGAAGVAGARGARQPSYQLLPTSLMVPQYKRRPSMLSLRTCGTDGLRVVASTLASH
jgi:tRNA-specific adenosine deaminase 1